MTSTTVYAEHSNRYYPHSRMTITPFFGRVVVTFKGALIADTQRALQLNEEGGDPVLYVPRNDCKMEHFSQTSCRVISPIKGTAVYWSLSCKDGDAENAAWSFEVPKPLVSDLRNHFAFRDDQVEIRAGGS